MSKQRTKGSSWERTVAKYLTDKYGKTFTRSAHSGAYTGGRNAWRKSVIPSAMTLATTGDITCPDGFDIGIECKNYADLPFHQIISGSCPLLDQWMQQTIDTGRPSLLLFVKISRKGEWVMGPNIVSSVVYKGWGIISVEDWLNG